MYESGYEKMYFSNYLIILLAIISIFSSTKVYRRFFNPCSLMNILWMIITIGSSFSFFDLRKPGEQTVNLVLEFLLAYSVATVIGPIVFRSNSQVLFFEQNVNLNNRLTDIFFFVITFSLLPGLIKQLNIISNFGVRVMHESYLYGTNGSLFVGIYRFWCLYVALPFFLSLYVYGIYDLIINKRVSKLTGQAVAGICMYFLTTGGRKIFLLCTIYLMICFFMKRDKVHIGKKIYVEKKRIPIIIFMFCAIVGLIYVLYYLTGHRLYGGASVIETICLYMFGGMSLLDIIVHSPRLYGIGIEPFLYGKCTMGMITIPISTIWSFLTGTDYQGADFLVNLYAEKFYKVSPHSMYNAAVTILYPMIRDFGWLGVIIGGILFGAIIVYVYHKACESKYALFWQVVLIIYAIIFSVWRYAFSENITVMTLIWSWILFRCSFFKRIRKQGHR